MAGHSTEIEQFSRQVILEREMSYLAKKEVFENVARIGGVVRFVKGKSVGRNQALQGNQRTTRNEVSREGDNRFLLKGTNS